MTSISLMLNDVIETGRLDVKTSSLSGVAAKVSGRCNSISELTDRCLCGTGRVRGVSAATICGLLLFLLQEHSASRFRWKSKLSMMALVTIAVEMIVVKKKGASFGSGTERKMTVKATALHIVSSIVRQRLMKMGFISLL